MEKRKMTRSLAFLSIVLALVLSIIVGLFVTGYAGTASAFSTMENNGDFYPDYETTAEAQEAAKELNIQMAEEGTILLKNSNNALPVARTEHVSVFGISSDTLQGTAASGWGAVAIDGQVASMAQALAEEGYRVNPALESFYADHEYSPSAQGRDEISEFTPAVERSFAEYKDVAFITVTRYLTEGTFAGDHKTVLNGKGIGVESTGATNKQVLEDAESDWHADLATNEDESETYKHELMLTNQEEALLEYVKQQGFKKIIYLVNAVVPIEYYNLENDPDVDGILIISRPGAVGLKGVANIISGDANPSGKTNQIYVKDYTADPIWQNVGFNNQVNADYNSMTFDENGVVEDTNANAILSKVTYRYADDASEESYTTTRNNIYNYTTASRSGSATAAPDPYGIFGIDYEEDIYRDYWYYETKAADMNAADDVDHNAGTEWYRDAVVYPFGYGLSYGSDFAYEITGITLDKGTLEDGGSLAKVDIESSAGNEAEIKGGTVSVKVTNVGGVAGKEAVQLYSTAPYDSADAPVEKPYVKLLGFEKTGVLQPGASQTVEIDFNIQDMASYDWRGLADGNTKGYIIEAGDWSLRAMGSSNSWMTADAENTDDDYDAVDFTVDADAYLLLDDFSGNETGNLFSPENGVFSSVRDNTIEGNRKFNESATAKQTFMSRADGFTTSFPQAPTAEDMTVSKDALTGIAYWHKFQIGEGITSFNEPAYMTPLSGDNVSAGAFNNPTPEDFEGQRYQDGQDVWSLDGEIVEEGTPGAVKIVDGATDFPWIDDFKAAQAEMAGWTQAPNGTETAAETKVSDMSGLSPYDGGEGAEAWKSFMDQLTYNEMEWLINRGQKRAIERIGMNALSGGDNTNDAGGYRWACNGMIASTWNKDIAYKQGRIIGSMYLLRGTNNAWWGGTVQVIRTVWAGRNGEFYSTDPMLCGFIGMNMTKGVREKGVATCTKHGILNDQQSPRVSAMITWISEQTIREIYAKPFQMAIQEGTSNYFMGSYANIGTMYNGINYNFVTGLMRGEWGATDMSYTTDNHMMVGRYTPGDLMGRVGNDNMDTSSGKGFSGTWDDETSTVVYSMADKMEPASGNMLSIEEIGDLQWYLARKNATIFINMHSKTQMNKNGVDASGWTDAAAEIALTQGVAASNATVAVKDGITGAEYVNYSVTEGELPEGVTMSSDGALTGTPLTAGDYTVTVTAMADGWVENEKEVTISVASGFTVSLTNGTAGTAFASVVLFEDEDAEITAEGLPSGLSISSVGDITGTPITPGTYTVTLTATTRTATYTDTIDIVIGGTASAPEGGVTNVAVSGTNVVVTYENGYQATVALPTSSGPAGADGREIELQVTDTHIQWRYEGDTEWNNLVALEDITGPAGPQGETGATGPQGPQGEPGTSGEGGCGGNIAGTVSVVAGILALCAALFVAIRIKKGQK